MILLPRPLKFFPCNILPHRHGIPFPLFITWSSSQTNLINKELYTLYIRIVLSGKNVHISNSLLQRAATPAKTSLTSCLNGRLNNKCLIKSIMVNGWLLLIDWLKLILFLKDILAKCSPQSRFLSVNTVHALTFTENLNNLLIDWVKNELNGWLIGEMNYWFRTWAL